MWFLKRDPAGRRKREYFDPFISFSINLWDGIRGCPTEIGFFSKYLPFRVIIYELAIQLLKSREVKNDRTLFTFAFEGIMD